MKVRATCIYNPMSRSAPGESVIQELKTRLGRHGYSVEFQATQRPMHAAELARNAASSGCDLIIACGGDGTIHEVVNGLAHTSAPLAILPSGTANVLARELRLPRNPLKVADLIPTLKPRRIALGKCGDRYFLLMAGVGVDAVTIENVTSRAKERFGRLAFGVAGLRYWSAGRFPSLTATIDGTPFNCTFAVVSRVKGYGGSFRITPNASLFDNAFELCLFQAGSRMAYLRYTAGVISRTHHRFRDVACIRGSEVEISSEQPVPIQLDGELHGATPARFEIIPDALTLLVPSVC